MRHFNRFSASVLGMLCLGLMVSVAPSAERNEPPKTGEEAIKFTAKTMDGKEVKFPDDYKGKLVILDFWATWCHPCMEEVPGLVKNYEQYHAKGVEVLGVSLDKANAEERVKKVTGDKKMTWPQVYDGKLWDAEVAKTYAIHSIPHAFLVDGDTGKIIADGDSLRGDSLGGTLDKAVTDKFKK